MTQSESTDVTVDPAAILALLDHVDDARAELIEITEGQGYAIESTSGGVICISVMDLVALSQNRTRMLVSLELRPTTLSSRLLLHSLKLAKSNLDRKFKTRVNELAKRIEG